jgi:Right handed beta helix region
MKSILSGRLFRAALLAAAAAVVATVFSASCAAATICVNPSGSNGCYDSIQNAVNHAANNDVVMVAAGTYQEEVTIGRPLSLLGAGAGKTIIDATNQPNGVLIDGYDHSGLTSVTVSGFTVENAQFEGILAVSATQVTISNNTVTGNDNGGINFDPNAHNGCPGQPAYETDETGDCGGAIHLIGVSWSTVSGNMITHNADGLLISDETAISQGNRVYQNKVLNNPLECGIVLASHPPVGFTTFPFRAHYGIVNNTITNNDSENNGVGVGGAGVGLFSDGAGPGLVTGNVISNNTLIGNGIAGAAIHSHVGPAFGAPADDFENNTINGNYISGNGADGNDTATPGTVGIDINSGGGGSPILGTNIGANVITNEEVDIAVNTPALVNVHTNNLLGGNTTVGVANICSFDGATICTGTIDADQNYWGCSAGPNGGSSCSTADLSSNSGITAASWLSQPVANGHNKK